MFNAYGYNIKDLNNLLEEINDNIFFGCINMIINYNYELTNNKYLISKYFINYNEQLNIKHSNFNKENIKNMYNIDIKHIKDNIKNSLSLLYNLNKYFDKINHNILESPYLNLIYYTSFNKDYKKELKDYKKNKKYNKNYYKLKIQNIINNIIKLFIIRHNNNNNNNKLLKYKKRYIDKYIINKCILNNKNNMKYIINYKKICKNIFSNKFINNDLLNIIINFEFNNYSLINLIYYIIDNLNILNEFELIYIIGFIKLIIVCINNYINYYSLFIKNNLFYYKQLKNLSFI